MCANLYASVWESVRWVRRSPSEQAYYFGMFCRCQPRHLLLLEPVLQSSGSSAIWANGVPAVLLSQGRGATRSYPRPLPQVQIEGLIVRFSRNRQYSMNGPEFSQRSFNWDSVNGVKEVLHLQEGRRFYSQSYGAPLWRKERKLEIAGNFWQPSSTVIVRLANAQIGLAYFYAQAL